MRLKDALLRRLYRLEMRGNWGGFSFEIERKKQRPHSEDAWRGNWGGFSFEIESFHGRPATEHSRCGNWGGFSFEIESG